jgi:dCMP deaminase
MKKAFLCNLKQIHLKKRTDYISWDEYFMGVALLSAKRSKDPNTQVGACIVSDKNKIVGAGYNGLPMGCDDDKFPWHKEGDFLDTKYPYICHAELNAILNNIGMDLRGCKIYTALFPCNECSKAIIQSGIKEVIYLSDKYHGNDIFKASKIMLDTAGVVYRKVYVNITDITLSFDESKV